MTRQHTRPSRLWNPSRFLAALVIVALLIVALVIGALPFVVPPDRAGAVTAWDVVDDPHIQLSAQQRADLLHADMDRRILEILWELSGRGFTIGVGAVKSDHRTCVGNGGSIGWSRARCPSSVSNHYSYRAVDIVVVNGARVSAHTRAQREVAEIVRSLPPSLRPSELNSPWGAAIGCPPDMECSTENGAAGNHIHIGFDGPPAAVSAPTCPTTSIVAVAPSAGGGYWTTDTGGVVCAHGAAAMHGTMSGITLHRPVVGMAATPTGGGYWLVASDGGIFAFGDATFHGSMGGSPLNEAIVAMAATPTGRGYWLAATDGGIFAFGDATFHESMGGSPLNEAIVAMAATPTGRGYWLAATDGGIFAFGDATFHESMGGSPLNEAIVAMAATPTGRGYWLAATDGGIFAFGDAAFHGSTAGATLRPVRGMTVTAAGRGYWLVTSDTPYPFGDATG